MKAPERYYALGMSANFYETSSTPQHRLGVNALGSGNTVFLYVQAADAISGECRVDESYMAHPDVGLIPYTAHAPFDGGEYGWVQSPGINFDPFA